MSAVSSRQLPGGWSEGFLRRHRLELAVTAIYVLSSAIAMPFGNFPLNDDWTYAKSILILVSEGRLDLGLSSSALLTQILWGSLFVKVFGFSFTLLRALTWISVLISVIFFVDLLKRTVNNPGTILLCCMALLFNPVYFSLSHTFMTDVHFCALLIICIHQAYRFWESGESRHFYGFFIASLMLIFLRQFGIIIPVAFSVACLYTGKPRHWAIGAFAITITLTALLLIYERTLMEAGVVSYQAASGFNVLSPDFWTRVGANLTGRYRMLLAQVFVYCAPLFLPWFIALMQSMRTFKSLFILFVAAVLTWLLYDKEAFPLGNILTNMSLGAETFYESLKWEVRAPFPHTYSAAFQDVLMGLQVVSLFVGLSVIGLLTVQTPLRFLRSKPQIVFALLAAAGYVFFLLVSEMYFDRYHLPLLILVMIAVMPMTPAVKTWQAMIVVLPMLYLCIAGTHDYFELNRQRWEAYHFLRDEKQVPIEKINGGNEVYNWHEGKVVAWDRYLDLTGYDYLIQYRAEPGFTPMREYPVYRWLTLKADKIYIFDREKKLNTLP